MGVCSKEYNKSFVSNTNTGTTFQQLSRTFWSNIEKLEKYENTDPEYRQAYYQNEDILKKVGRRGG